MQYLIKRTKKPPPGPDAGAPPAAPAVHWAIVVDGKGRVGGWTRDRAKALEVAGEQAEAAVDYYRDRPLAGKVEAVPLAPVVAAREVKLLAEGPAPAPAPAEKPAPERLATLPESVEKYGSQELRSRLEAVQKAEPAPEPQKPAEKPAAPAPHKPEHKRAGR